MKKFFYVVLCGMVSVLIAGCSSLGLNDKTLTVGVSANFPPLVSAGSDELVGFEIDLMNKVAEMTGKKVVYKEYPFTQLRRALLEGEIDVIIGGITVNPERKQHVSFTDTFIKAGQMHIVRKKEFSKYAQPSLLGRIEDLKIGVENRTTGDQLATKKFKKATINRYDSAQTALWALKKGEIDIVIHDAPTSWSCDDPALAPIYYALNTEFYAWAFRKGEERRFEDINAALFNLRKSLKLNSMWRSWVPSTTTVSYGK